MAARITLKGWRLAWYWLGLASLLGWVSIPFLWRTESLVALLLAPLLALALPGMLILGCILLFGQRQIRLVDFGAVSFAVLLGVWFSFALDEGTARRWVFAARYASHRAFVEELIEEFPARRPANRDSAGRQEVSEARAGRGGFQSAYIEYEGDDLRLELRTVSGPTLETVYFSLVPLAETETLRLVRRDDLGFWYFVVRQR